MFRELFSLSSWQALLLQIGCQKPSFHILLIVFESVGCYIRGPILLNILQYSLTSCQEIKMEGSLTVLGFVWILFSSSLLEIKAIAPLTCSTCNTGRFFLVSTDRVLYSFLPVSWSWGNDWFATLLLFWNHHFWGSGATLLTRSRLLKISRHYRLENFTSVLNLCQGTVNHTNSHRHFRWRERLVITS